MSEYLLRPDGRRILKDDWCEFLADELMPEPDPWTGEFLPKLLAVHELCSWNACRSGWSECPWHPPGCACSLGSCQEGRVRRWWSVSREGEWVLVRRLTGLPPRTWFGLEWWEWACLAFCVVGIVVGWFYGV